MVYESPVYTKCSLTTFAANVINLGVETCLVYRIPAIFTSDEVCKMSVARLEELASESDEVRAKRQTLQDEIQRLTEGLRTCKRLRPLKAPPGEGVARPAAD